MRRDRLQPPRATLPGLAASQCSRQSDTVRGAAGSPTLCAALDPWMDVGPVGGSRHWESDNQKADCHTLNPTAHNVHPEPNVLQVLLYALHPDPETVEARVT